MKIKALVLTIIMIIMIESSFAYTDLVVHVDERGESVIFGESNEISLVLPQGVIYENGRIKGNTNILTSKSGKIWTFHIEVKGAEIEVFLPDGSIVKNNIIGELFVEEYSFRENRIVLYGQDEVGFSYELGEEKNSKKVLWVLIVFLVLIGGILGITIKKNKKNLHNEMSNKKESIKLEKERNTKRLLEGVLNDREKAIISKLRKYGKVKSSYLRRLTGIPKASFFRHIVELEKKGLIKRSGEGKNKFVEVTKYGK